MQIKRLQIYNENKEIPCVFVGQKRNLTSLDLSACIETQRVHANTESEFAHRSDKEQI